MSKSYYSLGLMSGTSMDGVDASIIQTDGNSKYKAILDKYFEYPKSIYNNLTILKDKIKSSKDLKKYQKQIKSVEKEITIFHAESVNKILKKTKLNIDFIGFHGQTIYHDTNYLDYYYDTYDVKDKISKQLGDGKLLSKLTKKKVVYNFRQNDLKNSGQGAPLTPIFHKLLAKKLKIKTDVAFVNLGGIANKTDICDGKISSANDIGPAMCLIDKWIRINSDKKYDISGKIARSGKINKILLKKAHKKNFKNIYKDITGRPMKTSFDTKDFDLSFVKGLSLEDGTATLTEFTLGMILPTLQFLHEEKEKIILCGGGRKNKYLVERIKKKVPVKIIDDFGINGDFIESQAFAYLAVRSFLGLPISYPETTGCKEQCTGGVIVRNF
tara:strand:- start:804 stop:1955 length:1152 start_codon:yes stop_codon:yes gene_type:complete